MWKWPQALAYPSSHSFVHSFARHSSENSSSAAGRLNKKQPKPAFVVVVVVARIKRGFAAAASQGYTYSKSAIPIYF